MRRGIEGDYIWFGPLLEEAPRWLDTYIVEAGNQVLDIRSDTYDVRTAKPVGLESPLVAAETYLGAVARGDLQQARNATDQLLSSTALVEERLLIFGVEDPLSDWDFKLKLAVKENGDQADVDGVVEVRSLVGSSEREVYVLAIREQDTWRVNFAALVEGGDWRLRE